MNKKDLIEVVVSSTAGIVVGYGIGAFVTTRKMKKELGEFLDQELAKLTEELHDIENRATKSGPYASPAEAAEHLGVNDIDEITVDGVTYSDHPEMPEIVFPNGVENPEQYRKLSDLPEGEQPVLSDIRHHFKDAVVTEDGQVLTRPGKHRESFVEQELSEPEVKDVNLFQTNGVDDEEPDFDREAMRGKQDLYDDDVDFDKPYVITLEQYQTEHDDHDKVVVIYYEGDNTLTDEVDTLIPEIDDKNIGEYATDYFGHGSGAKNTVYVRNEKQKVDFEVVRMERGYAEEIFGIEEDEPRTRLIQRMRGGDDE